jgi:hypothetical protein
MAARANHQFSDVPAAASYHDAVDWLVNRGVTLGCVMGMYCPSDFVTRAQMALFMNRLGVALSPVFLNATGLTGGLDPDLVPTVCPTIGHLANFAKHARVHAKLVETAAGAHMLSVFPVVSTNGGASWTFMAGATHSRITATASGEVHTAISEGLMDLVPGTTYLFGVGVDRYIGTGTADITSGLCQTLVEITNRNPTSGPPFVDQRRQAPRR